MSNDFKSKLPTKTEKLIYDMAMQMHDMDHRLYSVSSHVLALGMLLKVDPDKMAEYLTGDEAKIRDYAQKINEAIQAIQKTKEEKENLTKSN